MEGVEKLPLAGILPTVEFRQYCQLWFVVYDSLNKELVMAFHQQQAAWDVASQTLQGMPFFDRIPVVPRDTPYPRPWLAYPSQSLMDMYIQTRIV